jgi:hypothetical protein
VAKERKAIDEAVKQQVSQALQEQFSLFSPQMTTMFAQMMMSQQQDNNTTKRSANYMQDDSNDDTRKANPREDSIKRRDKKTTPVKAIRNGADTNSKTWQTPDYLEQIATQSEWNESENSFNKNPRRIINKEGISNIMSESEDEDNTMHGSGNESINKSLANKMEVEAQQRKND